MNYKDIKINDYSYLLQNSKIAKYPLPEREQSNLLVFNNNKINTDLFENLHKYFNKNELLVFNNTKVIKARLHFYKITGAKIEIFCLNPVVPFGYEDIFQTNETCTWKCIVGNLKKWKNKELFIEIKIATEKIILKAEKILQTNNHQIIKFSWNNKNFTFGELIENAGRIPIPPYLNRESEMSDKERYQTVYSKHKGSVAAPTAGLHFSEKILNKLTKKGICTENITLHVGAGTFKPVKSETMKGHTMHSEHFYISYKTIENLIDKIGNITAIGTTSVRTLESIYWIAVKIINKQFDSSKIKIGQWETYKQDQNIEPKKALYFLLKYMKTKDIQILEAETEIIIVPGYKFKIVNKLITNFHQPRSTLLLLISAFVGTAWRDIYDYALNNDFRFLSYGDSSLLVPIEKS